MGGAKKKKPTKPATGKQPGAQANAQAEIVPHRKLYVGNLAGMDMTEAKLRELFGPCGEITLLDLVTTAKHIFGFVEFTTVDEASAAIDKLNGESGMLVKFANITPTTTSNASPVSTKSEVRAEEDEDAEEDDAEGETDKVAEGGSAEVERELPVHPDPVGASRRDYTNPVENLQSLVQKATRASSIRDHLIYTVEEIDEEFGEYAATLELRVPAGSHTTRGETKDNKNDAKKSAALAALRNPDVHRLLAPLPTKTRDVKAAKAESSDDEEEEKEEEEEWTKSCAPCATVSTKKQRQLEKAEMRAQRVAKRHAAKAIKAAMALEESDEKSEESEEESDDREDSTREDSEDQEESEEEAEESSEDDEDSDAGIDAAELAAKKATIKAALAKRVASKSRGKSTASSKEKEKSKRLQGDKLSRKDQKAAQKQPDVYKEVFSGSKWTQAGAKTGYVKP